MRRLVGVLVGVVLLSMTAAPPARAGDNSSSSSQDGASRSGDAVGGPAAGIYSRGDIRVEMTNRPGADDELSVARAGPGWVSLTNLGGPISVRSGDALGRNEHTEFVGLVILAPEGVIADG